MSKIILITGPSGSGKTTISKSVLEKQKGTWAYINQDFVRQFVKSGYASADGLRSEWNKQTINQWNASIPLCVDIAKRYLEYGVSSIIDFYSTYEEFKLNWLERLKDIDYKLIILMPDIETTIKRNSSRKKPARLSDKKITECFNDFQDWQKSKIGLKINNADMTIMDMANIIVEA